MLDDPKTSIAYDKTNGQNFQVCKQTYLRPFVGRQKFDKLSVPKKKYFLIVKRIIKMPPKKKASTKQLEALKEAREKRSKLAEKCKKYKERLLVRTEGAGIQLQRRLHKEDYDKRPQQRRLRHHARRP